MQINTATLSALFKGYRTQYQESYYASKPLWPQIAMKTTSSSAEELYHWLGSMSGLSEFTGKAIIDNFTASKYGIINKEFQKIVGVRRPDIERDSYGIYNPRMQMLGTLAAKHPDELTSRALINGFTTLDYTGKNFFDTGKVQDPGGPTTLDNKLTDKLSVTSFVAALAALKSVRNSNNIPMGVGDKFQLVVAPQNENRGKQILQSDFIMQTAQNVAHDQNVGAAAVTNINKGSAELTVWDSLSDQPNMWFLLATGLPIKPIIMQEEKPHEFTSLVNPEDTHVFMNNEFLYKVYGRYNVGYGLPQLAQGSNGTTNPADYVP